MLADEIKKEMNDEYLQFKKLKEQDLIRQCKRQFHQYGFVSIKCHAYTDDHDGCVSVSNRAHCCRWGEENGFIVDGKPGCYNGADIRFFLRK